MALTISQPEYGDGLWNRNFGLYFVGRQVSTLGDSIAPIAMSVTLLGLGYGAGTVGLVLASRTAPFALLVLFGGVLADRFHPRPIMIGADAVRAVVNILYFAVLVSGRHMPLWCFFAGSVINGSATAMFQPGVSSMVPQISTDAHRANGVLRVAEGAARLAGPALAGVIVGITGTGWMFGIDALTFLVSGTALLLLRGIGSSAASRSEAPTAPMRQNLLEGWQEFRSRTWLWSVILIWMANGIFVLGPWTPLGATAVIGAHGKSAYGFAQAAFGAGLILGGLVATRLLPERLLFGGAVAMFLFAAGPFTAATGGPMPVILGGFLLAGLGWAYWSVNWTTAVQNHVPADKLNRVYAYDVAGSITAIPIGQALAGGYASVLGLRGTLYVSSGLSVGVASALLLIPAVRTLRRIPGESLHESRASA